MFNKFSKGVGDALEFPPDVISDGPLITLMGCKCVIVENYRAILHFSEHEIRLATSEGVFSVKGLHLLLNVILPTELRITGIVESIVFERGTVHD